MSRLVVVAYQATWPEELIVKCTIEDAGGDRQGAQAWQYTLFLVGPAFSTRLLPLSPLPSRSLPRLPQGDIRRRARSCARPARAIRRDHRLRYGDGTAFHGRLGRADRRRARRGRPTPSDGRAAARRGGADRPAARARPRRDRGMPGKRSGASSCSPPVTGVLRDRAGAGRTVRDRAAGRAPRRPSVATAFARLGLPWDDAVVVSAHGRALRTAVQVCHSHPKVAVLTGPLWARRAGRRPRPPRRRARPRRGERPRRPLHTSVSSALPRRRPRAADGTAAQCRPAPRRVAGPRPRAGTVAGPRPDPTGGPWTQRASSPTATR